MRDDDQSGGQTGERAASEAAAPPDERERADHGQGDREEHAVVDARQQLKQDERRAQQSVARAAAVERAVPGPQGERRPERPLQLDVLQVIASVGGKGEHQPGDECSSRMAGESAGEHVGGRRRPGDASQGEQVEDRKRREPDREQRPGEDRLHQHRVRERQRLPGLPEDLPVEQRSSFGHVVDDAGQPPGGEGRVEVGHHPRREIRRQRPREEHGQRRVEEDDRCAARDARPSCRSGRRIDGAAIDVRPVGRMRTHSIAIAERADRNSWGRLQTRLFLAILADQTSDGNSGHVDF